MNQEETKNVACMKNRRRLGFKYERGGTHLARTMMLKELSRLLSFTDNPGATPEEYREAVEKDNCLGFSLLQLSSLDV